MRNKLHQEILSGEKNCRKAAGRWKVKKLEIGDVHLHLEEKEEELIWKMKESWQKRVKAEKKARSA